jgi:transcription initiation factor TFIIH subunit 3
MNAVDGSDHYNKANDGIHTTCGTCSTLDHERLTVRTEPPVSLLTIILDTNPYAWALLSPTLPLSTAIANLLVFINAHLSFNHANKVAVIASHTQKAAFLYPVPPSTSSTGANGTAPNHNGSSDDIELAEPTTSNGASTDIDANTYRPFRLIRDTLLQSLDSLISSTTPEDLSPTTSIAGALSLALTYINKTSTLLSPTNSNANVDPSAIAQAPSLTSRILILSVSGDLAHQYIPIMNTIFACQRLNIPIDIAKIAGDTVFLQQASDATKGLYMKLDHPEGLLQYLMMAFLPDATSRHSLVSLTQVGVDFRAACFCHRKVVDVGFVCSICLSSK